MKRFIPLILGCLLVVTAVAADSTNSQVFQIRLVLDQSSTEAEQMTLVQKWHDIYNPDKEVVKKEVLFVQKTVLLDQTDLKSAEVSTNSPTFAPRIRIVFTNEGAKRLSDVTRQHIGQRLAIIIEGQIYSAPNIATAITAGTAEIADSFNVKEARDLVTKINETLQK
jgi:preprotein translocase subunit SecD